MRGVRRQPQDGQQAPPFASNRLGKLSRLRVWLLRLGVRPLLSEPGCPDQNGRHERSHETLKLETPTPPRASIRAQQAAFTRLQRNYKEERPQEAMAMKAPSDVYRPSAREMSFGLPEHE